MRFTPKTDKELAEENLLPKGDYDYEVAEAIDTTSKKSGAEMISLKLRIYHGEGGGRLVNDYLLESMAGKLKSFCDSHGLQRQYEAGTLCAADCIERTGSVAIGIEKDKSGKYPDKNTVFRYVAKAGETREQGKPNSDHFAGGIDDDPVPFMRYDVPCL